MTARRVGLLGGSFDPIHLGHLTAARAAQDALLLDTVVFVPTSRPPHRPDNLRASGYHRFAMTALAVAETPGWCVSDEELLREGLSYTYDTLSALRASAVDGSQFFFILGADAFAEISKWWRYPDLLDLAHFVVVARPGTSIESLRVHMPALAHRMTTPDAVPDRPSIVLVNAATPDISSTAIRAHAADPVMLERLVPPAVARHIVRHSLYHVPANPEATPHGRQLA